VTFYNEISACEYFGHTRVRFLRKRLEALRVVAYNPAQEGKAFFGACVTLIDEDEQTLIFRIVGPDEIYGKNEFASVNAPVAKACLGKSVGDDVVVSTSDANKDWEIQSIDYRRH
jgi:transcription elongation factor GreB